MKKWICLILCLLLTLSIFSGCESSTQHSLRVGYGKVDISPTEPVPLSGYGNGLERLSTSVTERLYASCIAMTDENDNTILIFHMDLGTTQHSIFAFIRKAISEEIGVPMGNIMVASTHNHSAPQLTTEYPSIERYIDTLENQMIDIAKTAMADRKPAKIYTTRTYPEKLNFVRHYKMADGSYAGDGFGTFTGNQILGHASEADNEMQLIKFTREGAKDIILVNWTGHPHRDSGRTKTNATSDLVGAMRTVMEQELNCEFAYFNGAGGNINNSTRIADEKITKDYLEHGQALARYAVDAASTFTEVEAGNVQIASVKYSAKTKNENLGSTDIEIFTFSIGDIAFALAPYEMFDTNGVAIKKASPFKMTFIVGYANAHHYYIPSALAYEYGAEYEIGVSRFVPGTAEELEAEYIAMLNELYKTSK